MDAIRLASGNLLIPVRLEGDGVIGDGMQEITPDDPAYSDWEPFAVNEIPEDQRAIQEERTRPAAIPPRD